MWRWQWAAALLFGRRPPAGAAVRLPERSAAAAARQAADRYDRQAVAAGGPVYLPAGTNGAPGGLTNDLAAGDDDSVAAGARTRDANAVDDPRAVEIVAATSTTAS